VVYIRREWNRHWHAVALSGIQLRVTRINVRRLISVSHVVFANRGQSLAAVAGRNHPAEQTVAERVATRTAVSCTSAIPVTVAVAIGITIAIGVAVAIATTASVTKPAAEATSASAVTFVALIAPATTTTGLITAGEAGIAIRRCIAASVVATSGIAHPGIAPAVAAHADLAWITALVGWSRAALRRAGLRGVAGPATGNTAGIGVQEAGLLKANGTHRT